MQDNEQNTKPKKNFAAKHWHKINGILTLVRPIINTNLTEFVITKQGKNPREIRFVIIKQEVKQVLDTKKLKDRIKVRFTLVSRLYNDRYYTDARAEQIDDWKKETKKEKLEKLKEQQQDMFNDSQYGKGGSSLNQSDYNTDEWTNI